MVSSVLSVAVATVAVLVSILSLISSSQAAPPPQEVVRQASGEFLPYVIARKFTFVGKTGSADCAKSLTLQKTTPLADTKFGPTLGGTASELRALERFFGVVKYSDITSGSTDCSGSGEVLLANAEGLKRLSKDEGAKIEGFAQGSNVGDDIPGTCGGVQLPENYIWLKGFASRAPVLAKAVGESSSSPTTVHMITTARADRFADVLAAKAAACVYADSGASTTGTTKEPSSTGGTEEPTKRGTSEDPATGSFPGTTLSPTTSGTTTAGTGDNDSACFPADALVSLESGETKRMDQIQIGDSVMVGVGEYSKIFMFTHKVADGVNTFVTLKTASGASLSLTGGHYIYADDALVPAKDVRVGSSVVLGSGSVDRVVAVGRTSGTGLYNPQTVKGDVVVNGILASTYTTAVEPRFAHAVLAPFRWMNLLGMQCTAFESGGGFLGDVAPRGHTAL